MKDFLQLLVGTYTSGKSRGIYVYNFNTETGEAEYNCMVEVENPSFLIPDNRNRFIYAITENEDKPSFANSFLMNGETGELKFMNRLFTYGSSPCNIAIDPSGKFVITANYGGSISIFDIDSDGSLSSALQIIEFEGQGPHPERQNEPHIHCVKFSPDNKYIFVTDLGTDKIYRFSINPENEDGLVIENSKKEFSVKAGSGPRHMVFHPSGKFLYVINELAGTITCFEYHGGNLKEIQVVAVDDYNAEAAGDIQVSPDGKFVYASNRKVHDGIAIFSIGEDGRLTKAGYQETDIHPRNFILTPNGKFLLVANMEGNIIEVYKRNPGTGMLTNIHKNIWIDKPVCLQLIF